MLTPWNDKVILQLCDFKILSKWQINIFIIFFAEKKSILVNQYYKELEFFYRSNITLGASNRYINYI